MAIKTYLLKCFLLIFINFILQTHVHMLQFNLYDKYLLLITIQMFKFYEKLFYIFFNTNTFIIK